MKSFVLKLSIAALFFVLTVCAFAQQDFSHRFKAMRVPSGVVITMLLEADHSNGFSWQLVKLSDKTVLEFVKQEYFKNSKIAGSGGVEEWSFKTLKSGKSVVGFEYKQSWEKDVPAQRKEEFNVFVE